MIDIKLIRENKELVKENIKKKFQDEKLSLVDEIYEMDKDVREIQTKCDSLKSNKNKMSAEIGVLVRDKKFEEVSQVKEKIKEIEEQIKELDIKQETLNKEIKSRMLIIPNIIDESVPVGKNDEENVEIERFGEPIVMKFHIMRI